MLKTSPAVPLTPPAGGFQCSTWWASSTPVFKGLIPGEGIAPAVSTATAGVGLTCTWCYEPAPDPNLYRFKNTFLILLTYLASGLSEHGPFIDLSPYLSLQEACTFVCLFLNVFFTLNGS